VEEGQLEYTIEDNEVHVLTPGNNGVVEPTVKHHVRPLGDVLFSVEFYR
jgi:quercetin dioxygenase-like cupin family protein